MKKNIYSYENKKVWNLHGEAEATKSERIIMNVSMWVAFFACVIAGYLYYKEVIPMYWIFIFIAIPLIPLIIFMIKHFVIKKEGKTYSESYNIKGGYNNITGKDNIEITNNESKDLNNNNNEGD